MAFNEIPNQVDFSAQERDVLRFWKENRAFEKMLALHKGQPKWSFIDGPITANNPMGVHHGWGRTYKDIMLRFRTMQGHELRYQNGFDCQGLWVEVNVERELGFTSKKDIENYGLSQFVNKCKERVLRYAAVQTEQSIRLGYWMDWNNPDLLRQLGTQLLEDSQQVITIPGPFGPLTGSVEQIIGRLGLPESGGSYFTFSTENNYLIWAFLKRCWERGWLYKGDDVMPWCPRCATGISQHEIATEGYQELTHQALTVRFPLRDRPHEALLIWTTTPWTLTSNVAAAVGVDLTYVRVRQGDEILYLSKGTMHMLRGDYEILGELQGSAMAGWAYEGPFDDLAPAQRPGGYTALARLIQDVQLSAIEAHRVILWDAVGEAEGTGIVHIAPGCGAEDFILGKENQLPLIAPLDEEGHFLDGFDWLAGRHVSQAVDIIITDLERKGILYNQESYVHRYPMCWRCGAELVFRLVDEWFIRMGEVYTKPRSSLSKEEKTCSLRYQIMDVVEKIKWIPEFGYAREMDWLQNMHDWMISKKRYWGLALPIWECPACGHFEVIGDEAELKERAVSGWDLFAGHTPHRPTIDAVKLACPQCGGILNRVPDVGNPWLDAGIVPFSTLGYRSDRQFWQRWYPADWISESFPGQFRNWFYSLLALATVMENTPPFLENFGYATLVAEDGRPMHKSWGNSIEFNEGADRMGVDVMRWLYCNARPETDLRFGYQRGDEVRREFIIPLWNVYSFFITYARLDGWMPAKPGVDFNPAIPEGSPPLGGNLLDRWVIIRLNQVVEQVTRRLENSDFAGAALVISSFLDDLTNWYVRRSRRRFWKSEHDTDKNAAYATLYYILVRLIRLLAPFVPFVTEVMYQNLVRGVWSQAYESVHHTSWPCVELSLQDSALIDQMALARRIASLGLAARSNASLKVRQPLQKVLVYAGNAHLDDDLAEILKDELNVKSIEFVSSEDQLVSYRVLPDNKSLGPRFGARFPLVRAALSALDTAWVAARVRSGQPLVLLVGDETVTLTPDDVLVSMEAHPDLAVAAESSMLVGIDTQLTPELKLEGQAREVVRRIQDMRKKAGFNIEDRISAWYQAGEDLERAFHDWGTYIAAETLSTHLQLGPGPLEAFTEEFRLGGEILTLSISKNR